MKFYFARLAAFLVVHSAAVAQPTVTYVDATTSNTAAFDATQYPGTSWLLTGAVSTIDHLWSQRAFGNGATVFEANGGASPTTSEDAHGLVVTLTDLTPGHTYDIFGYFWSGVGGDNWGLRGSLTETPPLPDGYSASFTRSGTATSLNATALPTGIDGTDNAGVLYTGTGTLTGNTGAWTSSNYFSTPILIGEGNRALYQASLGKATADETGRVLIYIDDIPNVTANSQRTFFDGVGYTAADTDNDGMGDIWETVNGLVVGVNDSALDPDGDGLTNLQEFTNKTKPLVADTDDDGLSDSIEVAGPSDPLNPDSDGDLYLDGTEVARGTDPMSSGSVGYPTDRFAVDFSSDGSGGQASIDHDQDSFPFVAAHEVDSTADPERGVNRSETWPVPSLGGVPVTLSVGFPDTTDVRVKQMIGRSQSQLDTYQGTSPSLIRDWLGIDSRTVSGGNGTEAPTTLSLILSGIPAGTYLYRGFHHDVEAQRGKFEIAVSDASRSNESLGIFRITHSTASGLRPVAELAAESGPELLTSTIELVIVSNGSDNVTISYQVTDDTRTNHFAFFVINGFEITLVSDADNDFVPDTADLHPGQNDGILDDDSDNLSNLREFHFGTNPTLADSDEDGWNDDVETDTEIFVSLSDTGTSPFFSDWDRDGLPDGLETNDQDFTAWPTSAGTNPFIPDTDGDSHSDGAETLAGSDPTDYSSIPSPVPFSARVVEVDLVTGEVTLEWDSIENADYDIYASPTLEGDPKLDWTRIHFSLPSEGDEFTRHKETFVAPFPARRFYVIYEYPR